MARRSDTGRSAILVPVVVAAVLLALFLWMLATDRVWPANGPGPADQTIPGTPAPGAPTLPAQGPPGSHALDLTFV